MKGKTPISGYLQADIEVHCSVPPSYPSGKRTACLTGKRYPPTSDCDNLAKGLLDAMNGIVYLDDKQIVRLEIIKKYGPEAKAIVRIWPFTG